MVRLSIVCLSSMAERSIRSGLKCQVEARKLGRAGRSGFLLSHQELRPARIEWRSPGNGMLPNPLGAISASLIHDLIVRGVVSEPPVTLLSRHVGNAGCQQSVAVVTLE